MKPVSVETTIRRLIERRQLDRIAIVSSDGKLFTAIAYPAHWSDVVAERRKTAIAAATTASSKGGLSLAEVTAISDKAASDALARGTGNTIEDAVRVLRSALETGEPVTLTRQT